MKFTNAFVAFFVAYTASNASPIPHTTTDITTTSACEEDMSIPTDYMPAGIGPRGSWAVDPPHAYICTKPDNVYKIFHTQHHRYKFKIQGNNFDPDVLGVKDTFESRLRKELWMCGDMDDWWFLEGNADPMSEWEWSVEGTLKTGKDKEDVRCYEAAIHRAGGPMKTRHAVCRTDQLAGGPFYGSGG